MVIEFRCPNGHRLSCPEERAGRSGKCPKCGETFLVPLAGEPQALSDSGVSEPEMSESPGEELAPPPESNPWAALAEDPAEAQNPTVAEAVVDERIVFLCPNGHKLGCPASMQGRPGKCPHCGATFLVPEYEAEPTASNEESFADLLGADEEPSDESTREPQHDELPSGHSNGAEQGADFPFDFSSLAGGDELHVMAVLFGQLWEQRGPNGVVDIYLRGGEVLTPDWFAPRHSQQAYGMFAYANTDGSYTMTAVDWSAIERIALRGIAELPAGMFDGG